MSTGCQDATASEPKFSIIIPMEFHRGQWERCWQGWSAQTVDKSLYEIILVVSPGFQDHALLSRVAADCVVVSDCTHDIGLCVAGAAKARGQYLFFTECHCWPEPDVLENCLAAIDKNPDWAGFSCLSLPITHNRLSIAEADMYMADIEYAMYIHPWRRILDQCFVTSRKAYQDSGGFKPELGHFAEWELAANYFQRHYKLGYCEQAQFHHYYSGSVHELKEFTHDFVVGELRYFSRYPDPSDKLLEASSEWVCQGNFDRDTAWTILSMTARNLFGPERPRRTLSQSIGRITRWFFPAIFGCEIARISAIAVTLYARVGLLAATAIGTQNRIDVQFKNYIAALIAAQRLTATEKQRQVRRDRIRSGDEKAGFETLDTTGFYPLESFEGTKFRWSETEAAVLLSTLTGSQRIWIDCIPVRDLLDPQLDFRFFVDGKRIPSSRMSIENHRVSIDLDTKGPQVVKLGWTCLPLAAIADPRQLGMAVKRIALSAPQEPASRLL